MDYIENIKGCLTKYDDTETAKKWINRAFAELSSKLFLDFVGQIDHFSYQTNDKYAVTVFSSIAIVNPSSIVTYAIESCDIARSLAITTYIEKWDHAVSESIRREIESTFTAREERDRQHKEKLKAAEERRRRVEAEAERDRQAKFQRAFEKRAREVAEIEKREAEAAVAAAALLNASRQFDLLLFDLDDTLVQSSHLENFRGAQNVGNTSRAYGEELRKEAENLALLVPESLLNSINDSFPDLKLGIFTRAPRAYADILLATCYPTIRWDSVIAYEDVKDTKPSPEGIFAAAQRTKQRKRRRIMIVGDGETDIIAAYQAGCFAVLACYGWDHNWRQNKSNPRRREHYRTLERLPDAILNRPSDIVRVITHPWESLPALESWDTTWGNEHLAPGMRVDTLKHFNNLQPQDQPSNWVETKVMGRYYASHHPDDRFDFTKKSGIHQPTLAIIAAKDGAEYPDSWVACCANHISSVAEDVRRSKGSLVVCPVPARPGRSNRLERLVERIRDRIGRRDTLIFNLAMLRFSDGVASNKELSRDNRFINIRDHLLVADQPGVRGNHILVIDDVATSGATFYYADRYLKAAGAQSVSCVALTQTVSGTFYAD